MPEFLKGSPIYTENLFHSIASFMNTTCVAACTTLKMHGENKEAPMLTAFQIVVKVSERSTKCSIAALRKAVQFGKWLKNRIPEQRSPAELLLLLTLCCGLFLRTFLL